MNMYSCRFIYIPAVSYWCHHCWRWCGFHP